MKPSNLLFLCSDNHARLMSGCYGNRLVRTPNLDRLAARGVRFANAYTSSPVCCPARAALATGRYPHSTGYWDNCIVYDGRVRSWMHELRDAGYNVVSVGKLHYRSTEDDNGFVREIAPMHIVNGKGAVSILLRWSGDEPINAGQWALHIEKAGVGETAYQDYDRKITSETIAWLQSVAAKSDHPWAIFVSYVSPHPPFTVPQRFFDMYKDVEFPLPPLFRPEERPEHPAAAHLRRQMEIHEFRDEAKLRNMIRCYYALVTHLDEQVGEVLDALRETGLVDSTRVIYSSDHGESAGAHGFFGKAQIYEPAITVPLLMAGPDLPARHVVEEPVSHVDLYPTICDFANQAPSPKNLDGESLLPIISGGRRIDPPLSQYHGAGSKSASLAVRRGDWKLAYHVGFPSQLFNLADDPDETRDLAAVAGMAERLALMEAELRKLCDPEEVDRRAKGDQRRKAEFWGGNEAILKEKLIVYTPPPVVTAG